MVVRYVWRPWRFDVHARAFLREGGKGRSAGRGSALGFMCEGEWVTSRTTSGNQQAIEILKILEGSRYLVIYYNSDTLYILKRLLSISFGLTYIPYKFGGRHFRIALTLQVVTTMALKVRMSSKFHIFIF